MKILQPESPPKVPKKSYAAPTNEVDEVSLFSIIFLLWISGFRELNCCCIVLSMAIAVFFLLLFYTVVLWCGGSGKIQYTQTYIDQKKKYIENETKTE